VSVTFAASAPLAKSGASMRISAPPGRIGVGRGKIVALAGLAVTAILAVLALAPGGVLRVLPGLEPAYAALGFSVNLRGLEFERVTAKLEDVGGGRFLAVEGILHNIGKEARDAPRLRVTLSDAQGRPIYFWVTGSGVKSLAPGETAPFRARLAAPPLEAQSATVDFMP
jgi:hypothetical protein